MEENKDNNKESIENKENKENTNNEIKSPLSSRWKTFSISKVLENVKKQSEAVKEVYQRDLTEFVTTISTESQNIKQKISNIGRTEENKNEKETNSKTENVDNVENNNENNDKKNNENIKTVENENDNKEINGNNDNNNKRNSNSRLFKRNSIINKWSTGITSFLNKNSKTENQDSKKKKMLNRRNALIFELQDDPLTYLIDPEYDPESSTERILNYKNYVRNFDLFSHHVEIDKLLDEVEEVKQHHKTIVPVRLPEEVFWQRYFFKLKELEESEENKKQLVKDVTANIDQEEIKWDSDDDEKESNADKIKTQKDDNDVKKNEVNEKNDIMTTLSDKKTEESDDDWGNWE